MTTVGAGLRTGFDRLLRATFMGLSHRQSIGRLATRVPYTRAIVSRFVAGETLDAALPAIHRIREAGFGTTVDILGESVTSAAAAAAAADSYVRAIPALAAAGLDRNVSLKLSQMGLGISRDLARENLASVLAAASAAGAFVRIDMEDHTTTDATLALWRELRGRVAGSGDVGVVLQAALKRTARDVEELIAEDCRIRLCKGAYREPGSVAHTDRAAIDAAYVAAMERLLEAGRYPALATHDDRIIDRAVAIARERGIGPERFEFQMLFGVRRDLQDRLLADGWTVRVYVPLGSEWYPYFMRRLAERPANVAFVVTSLWRERRERRTGGRSSSGPAS